MHGTVNKAIERLITKRHSVDKWKEIKKDAKVFINVFQSNEPYDDNITFNLINSSSRILKISSDSMLFESGKCWVLDIGLTNYGSMITAAGNNFEEFMLNIPNFQTRLQLLYPNMEPPEFIIHADHGKIYCEYHSQRDGLTPFIIGAIHAIGDLYDTKINLEQLNHKSENEFNLFKISWN